MSNKHISRRSFLNTTASSLAAASLFSCGPKKKEPHKKPNILFALADDWGWPHAGAYGDKVVKTPAFDRLAREGVLFEHAFVSSPSCTPCRNSILTGQQFYRLEQGANLWSTLDVNEPNFVFLLRENGYEIGHWRKAWGPGDYTAGGYTEHPCGPESTFEDFMTNRDKTRPFCFWFGTSDPHRPYDKDSGRKSGINVDEIHVPDFYPNNETVKSDIADYYFEVQRWNRDVNTAINQLEQAGELDNTLIVMSGDHGMPFPRCKGNLYDWGVRVPLAMRWGNTIKPGRKVSDFVSFTDLAPTFLSVAGIRAPEVMTGKSLIPILTEDGEGRIDPERDSMVFGRERHVPAQKMPSMAGYPARALRTDQWLLILNLEPDRWPAGVPSGATHPIDVHADCDNGPTKAFLLDNKNNAKISKYYNLCFAKRPAIELYDCKTDPDQVNNLAEKPEYTDVVNTLKQQLEDYMTGTKDPRFTDAPVKFSEYPYQGKYLKEYLEKHGYNNIMD